ncbi:PAS domain S-box-containing protein [Brevundimonas alba]|uniref:histidine kinase n=1 Tax=Brevundimonas alba TaxID=74314 RepID=A0A7X5YKP3_9CAUL|nr:CHASE3 domain-containing protein [Brevundimonas alba]NJC41681.1 PAS domain S-box-containing protein [Brevundimonas alba]
MLLILAVLILTGFELLKEFGSSRAVRAEVDRSYQTRLQIQGVFSLLQDAETGQRGYVITGDDRFLQPYDEALRDLDRQMDRLGEMFSDQPEQQRDFRELKSLAARKLTLMESGIVARRDVSAEAAMSVVASGQGKIVMDDVRVVVARMIRAEAAQLDRHSAAAEARTRQTEMLAAAVFAALLIAVLTSAFLAWRYVHSRRAMLADIRAVAARQQAIFDGAIDAIITLNPSGTIETFNKAAERMFGYRAGQLERRDVSLLVDVAPDGVGPFLSRLTASQGLLENGLVRQVDARRSDGTTFPVDVALGPMELESGTHVVAVVRDISERRRVEQMKEEFVSTVSHELRTPLTSIAGSLGLLTGGAAGPLPEKAGRLIQIAHANSQRLVRLINDILDIEKIEAGKMRLDMSALDLRDIARRSIEGVQGFADGMGVRLDLAEGPPTPVRGDADRLIQVVTNLLSNAAKFSPEGSEVRVTVDPETRIARLSVCDQGPGIPDAFRSRIFSKFAQADGSDTRARGGTGLGLVIAREIAERHGGRLWFESAEGEGATFHLDLPLAVEPAVRAAGEEPRLLIVEDDADAAQILSEMLQHDGFTTDIVGTGREALAAARTGTYAALLVDLQLPDAGGIALIRALRSNPETRDIPVVVVSADTARGKARGRSLEVVDWMEKPFDQSRLRAAVAAIDQRRSDRRAHILHVDDDRDILEVTAAALSGMADITPAASLAEARAVLGRMTPDLVILDLGLPDGSGLELLADMGDEEGRTVPVIVYSAQEMDSALGDRVEAVLTKSRASLTVLTRTVRRLTDDRRP